MEVNKMLRAAKYGYIVLSALICALGVTLIAVPDFSLPALCWIGGVLLIVFGCVKILGYLSRDLYRLAFQFDLAFGILLIALGLILLLQSDAVMHKICLMLGLFILADSLVKVQISVDSRAFGIRLWWLILMMAVISALLGFLLLFRLGKWTTGVMALLGVALLGEGILNLTTVLTAVKIMQKKAPSPDGID